jgi:two-component system response regulator YesN
LYERFDAYKIPLDADRPVLLINGMVDEWPQSSAGTDRELMLYAMQNISEELLTAPHLCLFSVSYERRYVVVLIQTIGNQHGVFKYVQGMLERIQSVCKELLSLKLSFTVSSEFVDWNRLSRKYEVLRWIMNRSSALGQELLISDDSIDSMPSQSDDQLDINQLLDKLSLLEEELESGSQENFRRAYLEDTKSILPYLERSNVKVTVFYKLSAVFTSYLTKEGLWEKVTEFVDVEDLMPDALSYTWDRLTAMHLRLADWIFEQKAADASQHSRKVIHLINRYIDKNLSGDLSLTRLGEVVALNPVYLSRVYKQCTGENLSDYVLQLRVSKAKELITKSNGKMQDIAAEVGFDSPSYFTKCFKKITTLTPQEYRETMNR